MDNIINCPKGAKTEEDINKLFDESETCMNCPHIVYVDGCISCSYCRVN